MPQKIQILQLEKPTEYLKKEVDAVKSVKSKMLRDSDWTQMLDTGLLITDCLKWRHWRHKVRNITVTNINYDSSEKELQLLNDTKPAANILHIKYMPPPRAQFDYTNKPAFVESCYVILKEIFNTNVPDARIKQFSSRAKRVKMIDEVIDILIEVIEDGH